MSCGCKQESCYTCNPHTYENCIDLDSQRCNQPCPNGTQDTDCVFYNSDNKSGNILPNLGVRTSTSLTRILKLIDSKLNGFVTDFSKLNWCNANPDEEDVTTLYNTLQLIVKRICELKIEDDLLNSKIEDIKLLINNLDVKINNINNGEHSSSELNINTTDTINTVISKIIQYLEDFECCENIHTITEEIKISQQSGNLLIKLPDGYYVGKTPAIDIITEICNTPELVVKFQEIVKTTPFNKKFFLDNRSTTISQIVDYITNTGLPAKVIIPPSSTKVIVGIKEIITLPNLELGITYLGDA